MKLKGYLRVRQDGKDTAFVVSRPPASIGMVIIPFNLEIPDSLFEPPVMPTVEIVLNESVLPQIVILNDSVERLQDAGVHVRLVEK